MSLDYFGNEINYGDKVLYSAVESYSFKRQSQTGFGEGYVSEFLHDGEFIMIDVYKPAFPNKNSIISQTICKNVKSCIVLLKYNEVFHKEVD